MSSLDALLRRPGVVTAAIATDRQLDEQMRILQRTPAKCRVVRLSPVEPLNLLPYIGAYCVDCDWHEWQVGSLDRRLIGPLRNDASCPSCSRLSCISISHRGIHLVVLTGRRSPIHPEWARSLRDQCVEAEVPFYFEGWGWWQFGAQNSVQDVKVLYGDGRFVECKNDAYLDVSMPEKLRPNPKGGAVLMSKVGFRKSGDLLDGRRWRELPSYLESKHHDFVAS